MSELKSKLKFAEFQNLDVSQDPNFQITAGVPNFPFFFGESWDLEGP